MQPVHDQVSSSEDGPKMGRLGYRRSHRKSRLGCAFCKRRKIKCDEKKPTCSNCGRRGLNCSLSTSPPATPSSTVSAPSASCDTPSFSLDMHELQLFHHFCSSTAVSFSPEQKFWTVTVPQLAFRYPYLLHAILAVAALDLAHSHSDPCEIDRYRSKATSLWESALQVAAPLLADINKETRPALYLFATIACVYTLILGPKPGDYLLFTLHGPSEWLVSFRGMRSIELASDGSLYEDQTLAGVFCIAETDLSKAPVDNLSPEFRGALERLRFILDENLQIESPAWKAYIDAFQLLEACYAVVYASSASRIHASSYIVFAWLYRVPDEYLHLVQELQPVALAIFAYFVVLVGEMKGAWMLKGWPTHLITGIYDCMPEGTRSWIQWPADRIRWTSQTNIVTN